MFHAGYDIAMSEEATTCGQGLAEHAALPAKLGELTSAMADVLENHMRSLQVREAEHDAYGTLVRDYRALAESLQQVAARMTGYRDLPMAAHDEAVLADAQGTESFARYVRSERELVALLQSWVERDEQMLSA